MSGVLMRRLKEELVRRSERFEGVAGFSVCDLATGDAIELRGDEVFPSASTIKIHILTALLSEAAAGRVSTDERVAITRELHAKGSGVLTYLEGPLELTLLDIAVLMILVSDNTATNICIDRVGMQRVNALCAELGLKGTALRRDMQDAQAIVEGRENVTTPNDLVATLRALHDGRPNAAVAQNALSVLAKSKPSPIRAAIPAAVAIAHKTGRMSRVRAEAALVQLPDRPYVLAVMTKYAMGDDAEQDAFVSDMARTTHDHMTVLASSNEYGQGLPT